MNEDTVFSTPPLDPDDEPEATGDEVPEVQVTPPPLPDIAPPVPQDDVLMPPPVPVDPIESVARATVEITPSVPSEVIEPAPAVVEVVEMPSPFEAAEDPGVVTPSAVTAEPVSAVGEVVGEPAKKKNNTVLIIVIVAVVLLLLCCCCIVVLAAIGNSEYVTQSFENMWLSGLRLPVLR